MASGRDTSLICIGSLSGGTGCDLGEREQTISHFGDEFTHCQQFGELFVPGLIAPAVPDERRSADTELPRNERNQRYRRHLLRTEHPSRIA